MGAGIAIMHYVGMSALRANCLVGYSPPLVAASLAVAVAASGFALWLAFSPTARPHVIAGAPCMGLAISGMHYTGVAAATSMRVEDPAAVSPPGLSHDLQATHVRASWWATVGLSLYIEVCGGTIQ